MNLLKNISWSPNEYAEASILAHQVGAEMMSRLDFMSLQPKLVIDMGSGTGMMTSALQERYPTATVMALDHSEAMLTYSRDHVNAFHLCAEATQLPFSSQSVDLIFANFLLPWCVDVQALFREWHRVLSPDGLLMLSALGPDTLQECREAIQDDHVIMRWDMHDVGDWLKEHFADPVLDVDHYTLLYRTQEKLKYELQQMGMIAPNAPFDQAKLLPAEDGTWSLTYEVIYAHAFGSASDTQQVDADGAVRVPISQLKKR